MIEWAPAARLAVTAVASSFASKVDSPRSPSTSEVSPPSNKVEGTSTSSAQTTNSTESPRGITELSAGDTNPHVGAVLGGPTTTVTVSVAVCPALSVTSATMLTLPSGSRLLPVARPSLSTSSSFVKGVPDSSRNCTTRSAGAVSASDAMAVSVTAMSL